MPVQNIQELQIKHEQAGLKNQSLTEHLYSNSRPAHEDRTEWSFHVHTQVADTSASEESSFGHIQVGSYVQSERVSSLPTFKPRTEH